MRNHWLRIVCTADRASLDLIRILCIFFRLLTAFRTFVFFYDMPADKEFAGNKNQFIIYLFFADLHHLRTALLTYRMFFFMSFFFDREIAHPFFMCALCFTLMLRNNYAFFRNRNSLLFFIRKQCELCSAIHDDRGLFGLSAENLLFQPVKLFLQKCKLFYKMIHFISERSIFLCQRLFIF